MIGLWSGFYKHLSLTERSDSQVILTHERFHTSDPKAGDIVRVDESGYFEIIGEPKFNDKNGNDWFEVEIGRPVEMAEVRQRTRQKYQLANLRNLRSIYEDDPDDVEVIERHIEMCLEDKNPEAALVGWIACMENVDEKILDSVKWLRADATERKIEAESLGLSDSAKWYDGQIERYDYMIEAETALLEWKHQGLCAHAWDCDDE